MFKLNAIALGVSLALYGAVAVAQNGTSTGPSSSETPYIVPTAPGWAVTSLISVGDSAQANYYRMVGIPDGMGAVAGKFAENGTYIADKAFMTVFLNHEINPTSSNGGIERAHGGKGAFVSQWTVHLNSLQVKWGQDLIERVMLWDADAEDFVEATAAQFNRFCSGDLPPLTGFYNPATAKGFEGLIYMNGEEADEGRAFAHIVTGAGKGTSYELPYLGKFSWENSVAHPDAGDSTVVVGLDDSSPGQVYVYVGAKRATGNAVERAGLQDGKLYGVKVAGVPDEVAGPVTGTFSLVDLSAFALGGEGDLQDASEATGVTEFARPEDGHWDTRDPRVFYWVTTGRTVSPGNVQTARLYKFTFDSIANPTGGTIDLVVDSASLTGTDGATARSFDNLVVDADGNVIVQEDPGNSSYIAKTWKIDPVTKTATQIFEADRDRFLPGAVDFLTQDEETSGVIEVTDIVKAANWYEPGRRYYLGNMQAHYNITSDPELVQGGQVFLMASPKPEAPASKARRR